MTGKPGAPQRSWGAHVLAVLLVALALAGGLAAAVYAFVDLYPACVADFSEDTIVAPDSDRGRLLCRVTDEGDLTDRNVVPSALLGAPPVVALTGLVAWVRSRRYVLLAPWLLAAVLVPLLLHGAVDALPADCSSAQWEAHGAPGCERDEELRPGLGRY